MKKIVISLLVIISVFALSACSLGNMISPKDTVKSFLDKYKNQDQEILDDLDETISSEYTGEYKERYKDLMINQYKNMDYEITDEIVDGNTALVTADITVYDYSNAIDNANDYLTEHEEEFYKDEKEKSIDNEKFLKYKLGLLENVSDKKTYTIEFSLTKEQDGWKMDSLTDSDIEKLHGIYSE